MDFSHIDRETRLQLLGGTTITLVLHYSGSTPHYAQQISAAQNNVNPYVYEKLGEQAGNAGRAFSSIRVEVPEKALAAASQDFAGLVPHVVYKRECEPETYYQQLYLGQILPGYAMHVLTWYCCALRDGLSGDFLPEKPSVQECDKFFWLYSYMTMRKLGMHCFANSLGDSILGILVEKYQLVDEMWILDFVLENLTEGDPLFRLVADRYVVLENMGQSSLSLEQWDVITHTYPHFGHLVTNRQAALREMSELGKAMEMAVIHTEGNTIQGCNGGELEL
ncbi:hypothetical protein PMIN01_01404 [Paraphaeosphaeria minitans]|uniref:Uncharacterized protein n=1 Tax=Paraphaeosphaeria minitans TaxID=565426 RepID=A0A9P6KWX4_9PLEO|nr:hypothetical protein PMIN01_01404 [Paraphaeosphaeria minitans]